MQILILYTKYQGTDRRTIDDHMYSFQRYVRGCHFYYVNLVKPEDLSEAVIRCPFDAVILHYSFLAQRFGGVYYDSFYGAIRPRLMRLQGIKVLLPHDEYIFTRALWKIINDLNVQRVYSCLHPCDWPTLYPEKEIGSRPNLLKTVYTGYIDENLKKKLDKKLKKVKNRPLDIGYRSTKSDYGFGFAGQQKVKVVDAFMKEAPHFPEIAADVKLTFASNYSNTIVGDAWFDFLMSCRTAFGTLSGSSIFDPDGLLRAAASQYFNDHDGDVTDEEIDENCYHGADGSIQSLVFGPRHFEYAMTGTCPLLVEGDYGDLQPGVHYIEIKKDFSNMHEVLEKVLDLDYCSTIAQNYRNHFICSEHFTYRYFANFVVNDLMTLDSNTTSFSKNRFSFLLLPVRKIIESVSIKRVSFSFLPFRLKVRQIKSSPKYLVFTSKLYYFKEYIFNCFLLLKNKIKYGFRAFRSRLSLLGQYCVMPVFRFLNFLQAKNSSVYKILQKIYHHFRS